MTETKKRVMITGLLLLCLAKLLNGHNFGLSELITASGAWCCIVWLWNITWPARLTAPASSISAKQPLPISSQPELKFTGPFDLSYKVPGAFQSREQCERAIRTAFIEFDAVFPRRRVSESLEIEYKPQSDSAVATVRFSFSLRYAGPQDAAEVDGALFGYLAKQGFPK